MEEKLCTHLTNFRLGKTASQGIYFVDWFRYDLDEKLEDNITGFNRSDLDLFLAYTLDNPTNFPLHNKNAFIISEGELPSNTDILPEGRLLFPEYFILKPNPKSTYNEGVLLYPEIVLLNNLGSPHHIFNLPFGVIGRVTGHKPTEHK